MLLDRIPRPLRYFLYVILFLLFSYLLSWFFLPIAAENAVEKSFSQGLGVRSVQADIKVSPVFRVLANQLDRMTLRLRFRAEDVIAMKELRAEWQDQQQVLGLIRSGQGAIRDAEPLNCTLVWDEESLARYLLHMQDTLYDLSVQISEEAISISGSLDLSGSTGSFQCTATAKTNDLGEVRFELSSFQVEGLHADRNLQAKVAEALSFSPDLSPLDWKVWAKQVTLQKGEIEVYGESSCCR